MYGGTVTPTTTVRTENYYHYYAFGSPHPNRYYEPSGAHHWGFNTQERKDDYKGIGNHNHALYWEYDTRIGRRWNIDPVVKFNRSPYDAFDNSPVWKMDAKGDDDYFTSKGVFSHRTKSGSSIIVMSDKGDKPFSQFASYGNNAKASASIFGHYFPAAGVSKDIKRGVNSASEAAKEIAHASKSGIWLATKGKVSSSVDNYNNLISVIVHEKTHKKYGDENKQIYSFNDHIKVYFEQLKDKTFDKTDEAFKMGMIQNTLSYMLGASKNNELTENEFNEKLAELSKVAAKAGIQIIEKAANLFYLKTKNKEGEYVKEQKDPH